MPKSPSKNCSYPGCSELVPSGRCDKHKRKEYKQYDDRRGNSGQRGYDARWQGVRAIKASQDPLCEMCLKNGHIKPLDVVHHIRPIETHPELRLSFDNLMSVCVACHESIHQKMGR